MIKSLLKVLWANIWPTDHSSESTKEHNSEFSPQKELDSKLDKDLAYLASMAGSYVFWQKDSYEVWREGGMFYIAVPNRVNGSVFCSPSSGKVLNIARGTLKIARDNMVKDKYSLACAGDFLRECRDIPENKDLLKYPATFEECYVMEEPKISQFTVDKMREAHLKQLEWYKILMGQIELFGEVSEQSVILNKMDEIIHRAECEELLVKYDKNKNKGTAMAFFNHLVGNDIPHPYPSELI